VALSVLLSLCLLLHAAGAGAEPAERDGDMLGETKTYVTQHDDTLLDVARYFDVGFVQIRAANPEVDPWLPGAGTRVVVPSAHLLPAAPRRGIVINLAEMQLYFFLPNRPPRTYPIGIGRDGYQTPTGSTTVARKVMWPSWRPTPSALAEDPDLPTYVAPGPDNPMGIYALYLGWPHYAIHDTNKPDSVGRRGSDGCLRLYREDAEELFPLVEPGTAVHVVDQPIKTGWRAGELYLEVHPGQPDADAVESGGRPSSPAPSGVEERVAEAAGSDVERIDWYAVGLAALARRGVPVRVTLAPRAATP
jgi:L,D-transpeptidase ErfK/SrfK